MACLFKQVKRTCSCDVLSGNSVSVGAYGHIMMLQYPNAIRGMKKKVCTVVSNKIYSNGNHLVEKWRLGSGYVIVCQYIVDFAPQLSELHNPPPGKKNMKNSSACQAPVIPQHPALDPERLHEMLQGLVALVVGLARIAHLAEGVGQFEVIRREGSHAQGPQGWHTLVHTNDEQLGGDLKSKRIMKLDETREK